MKRKRPNTSCTYSTPHSKRTLPAMACRGLTWDFQRTINCYSEISLIYEMKPSFVAEHKECGVYGISAQASHKCTSWHNSLLLHDPCPAVREPRLTYMDANAAVLLHFVLIMHTPVCCANRATILKSSL